MNVNICVSDLHRVNNKLEGINIQYSINALLQNTGVKVGEVSAA